MLEDLTFDSVCQCNTFIHVYFCCNLEIIILLTLMMTSGAAMSRSITQCSVASARQFNFVVITTWLTYFIIFAWGPRFKISEDILCGGVQS